MKKVPGQLDLVLKNILSLCPSVAVVKICKTLTSKFIRKNHHQLVI